MRSALLWRQMTGDRGSVRGSKQGRELGVKGDGGKGLGQREGSTAVWVGRRGRGVDGKGMAVQQDRRGEKADRQGEGRARKEGELMQGVQIQGGPYWG